MRVAFLTAVLRKNSIRVIWLEYEYESHGMM